MPDRFGSNESPYDALRAATLGSVSRADSNNDLLYLRLDATNDPITGALDIDTSSTTAFRVKSGANVTFAIDTVTPQTIVYQDFLHYDPTFNFGLNRTIFTDVNGVLHEWTKAVGGVGDQRATISLIPKGAGLYGTGTSLELFVDDSTGRYLEMRAGTAGNKIISRATAPSVALPLEFAVGQTDTPPTTMILDDTIGLRVLTAGGAARLTIDTLNAYNTLADNQFRHTDINGNGLIRSIGFDGAGRIREFTSPINANQSANISLNPTNSGWLGVGSHIELRDIVGAASKVLELRMGTTGAKIASWSDDAITDPRPIEVAIGPDTASLPIIAQFQNTALDSAVFVAQGKQYTSIRINGTTHGQLILAANSIDQWSLYSQSDHILRFYKFDGTPGDAMSLTNAGVLTTSRFISTIATGTAPLDVSSTTLVTNLNADLLDGLHASSFPNVGAASAQYQYITTGAGPTYTPAWSGGYLNISSGKTLAATGTLTLTPSSDGLTLTVPATGTATLTGTYPSPISNSGDVKLTQNGNYRGGVIFDTTGALVAAPWTISTMSAGTSEHDNVMLMTYNLRHNRAGGTWERIVSGEHGVRFGFESRWLAVGDPTAARGSFEWNLDIEKALTGAPAFGTRPFALNYDFDNSRTLVNFGDSSDDGNQFGFVNGSTIFQGGSTGYAIDVQNRPSLFRTLIQLTGPTAALLSTGTYTDPNNPIFNFDNTYAPSSAYSNFRFFLIGYNVLGSDSTPIQSLSGFSVLGATWTKGTSANIVQLAAMQLTVPTVGVLNAGLVIGALPGVGSWALHSETNLSSNISILNSTTNAIDEVLRLSHNTSGTAANGLGVRQLFALQSSTTADQSAAALDVSWSDATHATRTSDIVLSNVLNGSLQEALRISGSNKYNLTIGGDRVITVPESMIAAGRNVANTFTTDQTISGANLIIAGQNNDAIKFLTSHANAPYNFFSDKYTFNGTVDDRVWLAFNINPVNSQRLDNTLHAIGQLIESDYNDGSRHLGEWNFNYISASGTQYRYQNFVVNLADSKGYWAWWGGVPSGDGSLVINSSGKVGVNSVGDTTNSLLVEGDAKFNNGVYKFLSTSRYLYQMIGTNSAATSVQITNSYNAGSASYYDIGFYIEAFPGAPGYGSLQVGDAGGQRVISFNPSGGGIGLGTTSVASVVKVELRNDNTPYTTWNNSQLRIAGASDPNKFLSVGYDTTTDVGVIQAANAAYDFTALYLNKMGTGVSSPVIIGSGTSSGHKLQVYGDALISSNNAAAGVSNMLTLTALGSGANGDGGSIDLLGKSSTTVAQSMAALKWLWNDATHASRKARILGKLWDTTERQWLQVDTDGSSTDVLIDSLIYGSMYADDISQTETVGAANTEVKVTGGLSGGTCNGFTFQNSKELLCLVAGNYEVKWGMSVSSGTNNEDLSGGVVINTTTWQHSTEGSSNQPNSGHAVHIDGSGIITLAANDTVGLFVENESGGHNITIRHANLSLVRIGA